MKKGTLSNFLKGTTRNRIPKLATLAAASAILVTMVNIDASASPAHPNVTGIGSTAAASPGFDGGLDSVFAHFGRHHGYGSTSTTTTIPVPTTTTDPAPTSTTSTTSTDPAPTTTTTTDPAPTTTTTAPAAVTSAFPIGQPDNSEPSGFAPPAADALAGYTQVYVSDFTGSSLPGGWDVYSGTPGGDPGAQFGGASHVIVGNGMLSLETFQDPNYGNEWVTGGLCQCGNPLTYGAFFVRSRVTGAGPTNVELLWPANNTWPPEIDFNETSGVTTATSATDIWAVNGSSRSQLQSHLTIDMSQWHTWGVIWTPTSITYTVDGQVWGQLSNSTGEVPSIPMTLDLQQQTWCSSGFACPSAPQSMQIDWVAEYSPNN